MSDSEYMARVRAMERKLYRVAYAILWNDADCADAIQEAVFKGWMKRGGLREEAYLETWLIRILINECRSLMRKNRRGVLLSEHEQAQSGEWSAQNDCCESLALRDALHALPEKYRLPLVLHYLEGQSLNDVARALGISTTLAKSRMHQARKALRDALKEDE